MLIREGKLFEKTKIDIKGLSIKKVSTNKNTRDYFENVLEELILTSGENISFKEILNAYYEYESELLTGLTNHKVDYLIPAKYGSFSNYALPWRVMAVKATYLWNSIYPEDPIQDYEKIRIAKLNIPYYETIEDDDNIPDEIKKVIKTAIFENEEIAHLGAAVIALPLTHQNMPEWIVPYLNINVMVSDNLNAAMPIFEATDMMTTTFKAKKYLTNLMPIQYE